MLVVVSLYFFVVAQRGANAARVGDVLYVGTDERGG